MAAPQKIPQQYAENCDIAREMHPIIGGENMQLFIIENLLQ